MRKPINGILLLDKPINMTSNGALQRVKRLFNAKKAGHTGSLDPIATGMLPICFGEGTKFSQFLLESDKSYAVVAQLGVQTTTGDSEGEVLKTLPVENVNQERIEQVMQTFLGDIEQVPPMYSALKFEGKPLYELARKGIEIERKARNVKIFSLRFDHYVVEQQQVWFEVHCSKGTYVRTLVEDIGKKLGCGAHVIGLRRLTVTPYDDKKMYTLDELEKMEKNDPSTLTACLLPIETAVDIFPAVKLTTAAEFYMRTGQSVRATFPLNSSLVRLFAEDERFLGIGEVQQDGRVKPHRMLATI